MAAKPASHQAQITAPQKAGFRLHQQVVGMAMGNPDGDSSPVRKPEYEPAVVLDVAVNDVVGPVLAQSTPEIAGVKPRPGMIEAGYDAAAQGQNFIVVGTRTVRTHQKVHLHDAPIDSPQHLHEPGFDPAAVHPAQHMQYA